MVSLAHLIQIEYKSVNKQSQTQASQNYARKPTQHKTLGCETR